MAHLPHRAGAKMQWDSRFVSSITLVATASFAAMVLGVTVMVPTRGQENRGFGLWKYYWHWKTWIAVKFYTEYTGRGLSILSINGLLQFRPNEHCFKGELELQALLSLLSWRHPEICTNKMLICVLVENIIKENQFLRNLCDSFY